MLARVEVIHKYIITMMVQKDFILSPVLIANAEQMMNEIRMAEKPIGMLDMLYSATCLIKKERYE